MERGEQAQSMLDSYHRNGMILAERWSRFPGNQIRGYGKYKKVNFLEGIPKDRPDIRGQLSTIYENTHQWIRHMDETTRMLQVGSFEKFVFPVIRAVFANLVAADLVTTQALQAPTGLVFYFDAIYGTQMGNINRGTKMFDARLGPSAHTHFTDEMVEEEEFAGGTGAANYIANLSHVPVRSGTVRLASATQQVQDDGNGVLVGDATGTVDYNSGRVNVTFDAAVANGDTITATYEFNMEATGGQYGTEHIPEIDLILTSSPVTARPHKLRARWSLEAQQDLSAYHGINAEVELVAFMANEIAKEINYKIINHLAQIAAGGAILWDRTPPAGVQWLLHKQSLYDAFVDGSNQIFARTQRRQANWVVASTQVCTIIETLANWKGSGNLPNAAAGIFKAGQLGDFTVYKDPRMAANRFLMGFKGNSFLDAGYIYAPYLGVQTTPTITLDDFLSRKGMMQRVGTKVVNPNFYLYGEVEQTGGAYGD